MNDNEKIDDDDDDNEDEPMAKKFCADTENYDIEDSNDSKYNSQQSSAAGIPSLLNISVNPPNSNYDENSSQKSPITDTWNENNSVFNNNGTQKSKNKDGRRQGSRWSSRR